MCEVSLNGIVNGLESGSSLEPVAVSGSSLTLDVPPLNYRLLWVR